MSSQRCIYENTHTHTFRLPTCRLALRLQTKHWNRSAATNPRPRGVGLWSHHVVAGSRGAHADRTQNRILFYVFLWSGEGDVILITSVDSFGRKAWERLTRWNNSKWIPVGMQIITLGAKRLNQTSRSRTAVRCFVWHKLVLPLSAVLRCTD